MITSDILEKQWVFRNAAIQGEVLRLLSSRDASLPPLTTKEIAELIAPKDLSKAVGGILTRLAKHIPPAYATHDGEEFLAYGRTNRRWRWHGQKNATQKEQPK